MTEEQYYSNPDLHGNYQFVSLKEVIDNMMLETHDEDSFLKNTSRYKIFQHALQGIKNLNKNTSNDILAFEITIPESLFVVVPIDFVSWVRISVVINGELMPLNENKSINTAVGYLQDHNYELLFDHEGMVLTADASNSYNKPFKRYSINNASSCGYNNYKTNKVSEYGEFVVDERRGSISFSSDLMDKEIVIEYISDGLQGQVKEHDITIHKDLQETLENWIYYSCIERRRNVPANEKQRALNRYKTTLHQAKLYRLNIKLYEIKRHF